MTAPGDIAPAPRATRHHGPWAQAPAGVRLAAPGSLLLIQVLLNAPVLAMALVESLARPLLSTMMISVGLCVPMDVPLAAETL